MTAPGWKPYLMILVLLFVPWVWTLTVGESCNLAHGEQGTCVMPQSCPAFYEDIQRGVHPNVCGYQDLVPITCCPKSAVVDRNFGNEPSAKSERISQTKCREYSNTSNEVPLRPLLPNFPAQTEKKECAKFDPFVVGGHNAMENEFSHMAALGYRDGGQIRWNCGGALISESYVLTAAHCLQIGKVGPVELVRLGEWSFADNDDKHFDVAVARRIPHPDYRPPAKYHDIALLELARNVSLSSSTIKPACLRINSDDVYRVTATGWGHTSFGGKRSDVLQKVGLKVIPNEQCNDIYGNVKVPELPDGIRPGMMCAGDKIGKDTCQGDSGGPLHVIGDTFCYYEIVGVTSFGLYCGSRAPGVYTKVSPYVEWIESVVWPEKASR